MLRLRLQKRTITFLVCFFTDIILGCDFLLVYLAVSEPAPTANSGVNAKGIPQATYPKTNSGSHCIGPTIHIAFGALPSILLLLI